MKLILKTLLGLVLILGVLIALNLTKIKRLQTVNTLFDADKIVYNFSHMKDAFLFQQLDGSAEPHAFPENPMPLPETIKIAGQERNLAELLETLDTTSFIVLQDGAILNEAYFKDTAQTDHRISWSVAKSFMSGLYGQAVESGQIKSLDDTVETYAPALKGSAYEGASIRNVLNMASGITFDEDYMNPKSDINDMGRVLGLGGSMDEYAAGLTARDVAAGARWKYVSIDTHVAAMVLRAATGKSLHQLFNETYSANLGFEGNPYYLTDGENVAFALGGLNLTTRDYAKFGQLFLQGGEWNGRQVIPADWVAESTAHSAPTRSDRGGVGYGYQWWVPPNLENGQEDPNKGDFFAVGIYGQYIYVNPARNLVIAKNAADREFAYEMEGYGHSMNVNVDLFRSLANYYGALGLSFPRLTPSTDREARMVGNNVWVENGNYGAQCRQTPEWECFLIEVRGKKARTTDLSGVIQGNLSKLGPTQNYDEVLHFVEELKPSKESDVIVTVVTQVWEDGKRKTVSEPLLVRNGVPMYR